MGGRLQRVIAQVMRDIPYHRQVTIPQTSSGAPPASSSLLLPPIALARQGLLRGLVEWLAPLLSRSYLVECAVPDRGMAVLDSVGFNRWKGSRAKQRLQSPLCDRRLRV